MTKKETVERNIGLTIDFVNHLIDNPKLVEDLPEDFKLEFLEMDSSNTPRHRLRNQLSPFFIGVYPIGE
jgi:hypothetical protein